MHPTLVVWIQYLLVAALPLYGLYRVCRSIRTTLPAMSLAAPFVVLGLVTLYLVLLWTCGKVANLDLYATALSDAFRATPEGTSLARQTAWPLFTVVLVLPIAAISLALRTPQQEAESVPIADTRTADAPAS